ncbi:MAG: hypothetical protein GX351_02005 [Peptococcaceae bacterium]|nr:hypothetical protein [Peptococcaceae bacterium]
MCFRPSTTIKPIKCPVCSSVNSSIAKKCAKCKADLVAFKTEATDADEVEDNIVSKQ